MLGREIKPLSGAKAKLRALGSPLRGLRGPCLVPAPLVLSGDAKPGLPAACPSQHVSGGASPRVSLLPQFPSVLLGGQAATVPVSQPSSFLLEPQGAGWAKLWVLGTAQAVLPHSRRPHRVLGAGLGGAGHPRGPALT